MKHIFVISFVLISLCSYGQSSGSRMYPTQKNIGKTFSNNRDIIAQEYTFSDRIHNFKIDTTRNLFFVELRNIKSNGKQYQKKGKAFLINSQNNRVLWERKINYSKERIHKMENYILLTNKKTTDIIDINELYQPTLSLKNSIYYIDFINNIGIGYKGLGFFGEVYLQGTPVKYSKTLEGIDLKSGKVLWQRDFAPEKSFDDLWPLSDSVYIVRASGLHTVNVHTGKGWDYTGITLDENFKRVGNYVFGVKGIQSNVIIDSLHIYFATKEKVSCLTQEGEILWSTALPINKTSKSRMFLQNDILYMINYGYVNFSSQKHPYGAPYIAAFDLQTGKELFFTMIDVEKEKPIVHFKVDNDTCLLLFKDRIDRYSLSDGTLNFTKQFDLDKTNYFSSFAGIRAYIQTDSIYQPLIQTDTTKHYILNASVDIITYNNHFNEIKKTSVEELYSYFYRINDFRFLRKESEVIIINQQKKEVAKIDISHNAKVYGNVIYDKKDSSLLVIDLSSIVGNPSDNFDFETEFGLD
jgi:hypothetical protein